MKDRAIARIASASGLLLLLSGGLAATQTACNPSASSRQAERMKQLLRQERAKRRAAELEKELVLLKQKVAAKKRQLKKLTRRAKRRPRPRPRARDSCPPSSAGASRPIAIRILGYRSRRMSIEIHNRACRARSFDPDGLYFIPVGTTRFQRMGAIGPYEVWEHGRWIPMRGATRVSAGSTLKLRLQVYCLDKRRASPTNGLHFKISGRRLPKRLHAGIKRYTRSIIRDRRRLNHPAMRQVQRRVWEARDTWKDAL